MLITGILLLAAYIIFAGVCTIIANSVISSMADVRVEKNEASFADYALDGEQVAVVTTDGILINAYLIPHPQAKANVIVLHGMHGMDATSLFGYASFLYDAGYSPVVVDMRAHGLSGGNSLSFGYLETLDVLAVLDCLEGDSRFAGRPMVLYGLSMGGSTAINTAAQREKVAGAIAISPFKSIQAQVHDYMARDGATELFIKSFMPYVNLVLRFKFGVSPVKDSPAGSVGKLGDIPVLLAHGTDDSQTAYYH